MSDQPLTPEELADLTGYVRASEQMRELQAHGLKPFRGRDGRPKVTWAAINASMFPQRSESAPEPELNWNAVKRRA